MWNLASLHLETMLVFVQLRCMVCARHNIGSNIILDALDGTTKVTRLKWKHVSVLSAIVLILTQDRCIFASNIP
jgi:hypothetical protein